MILTTVHVFPLRLHESGLLVLEMALRATALLETKRLIKKHLFIVCISLLWDRDNLVDSESTIDGWAASY